ncbi:uncharacterized protein LOC135221161 [Macrobrachium nipponense]|uniref:uncharacterized protein LOC135221161 n=1 Tax=Macrobrachium nipponense TaxID=159736 RepID=UPI0030C8918F
MVDRNAISRLKTAHPLQGDVPLTTPVDCSKVRWRTWRTQVENGSLPMAPCVVPRCPDPCPCEPLPHHLSPTPSNCHPFSPHGHQNTPSLEQTSSPARAPSECSPPTPPGHGNLPLLPPHHRPQGSCHLLPRKYGSLFQEFPDVF